MTILHKKARNGGRVEVTACDALLNFGLRVCNVKRTFANAGDMLTRI